MHSERHKTPFHFRIEAFDRLFIRPMPPPEPDLIGLDHNLNSFAQPMCTTKRKCDTRLSCRFQVFVVEQTTPARALFHTDIGILPTVWMYFQVRTGNQIVMGCTVSCLTQKILTQECITV
jgi:hypothetical protein